MQGTKTKLLTLGTKGNGVKVNQPPYERGECSCLFINKERGQGPNYK